MHNHILENIITLIGVAGIVVVLFKKLKLSPVLGYLVAGGIIGDHGFKIVAHAEIDFLAECGIVFLLFAIGLELSFEKLRSLRKYIFGVGVLQTLITGIVFSGIAALYLSNIHAAIIIGGGLALSSTAIVMQLIEESGMRATQVGRVSLAVLLLQDFAVIPLLIMVPVLAGDGTVNFTKSITVAFVKAILVFVIIFLIGRLFLRPIFRLISSASSRASNEIFIAVTILIALSSAYATHFFGLSLALGAFIAGILVAETEFRVQAEESIHPFKGLLLGLFFMTIGMTINIKEMFTYALYILVLSFTLIIIKCLIIYGLCIIFGFTKSRSLRIGGLLSQGGEFAFILFALAAEKNLISALENKILMPTVTLTMALTPIIVFFVDKIALKLDLQKSSGDITIDSNDIQNHVIIAGFGSVGTVVAGIFDITDTIKYIAIDIDQKIIRSNMNNINVLRGDVTQIDVLKAAGIEHALSIVITIHNEVAIHRMLQIINDNFPHVAVILRLRNLRRAQEFLDICPATVVPENYETALQLSGSVFNSLGISAHDISKIKNRIRDAQYDLDLLKSGEDEKFDISQDVI